MTATQLAEEIADHPVMRRVERCRRCSHVDPETLEQWSPECTLLHSHNPDGSVAYWHASFIRVCPIGNEVEQ